MARELGVFIPTAPHLLDILRWKGMKSSKGTGQQLSDIPRIKGWGLPCEYSMYDTLMGIPI